MKKTYVWNDEFIPKFACSFRLSLAIEFSQKLIWKQFHLTTHQSETSGLKSLKPPSDYGEVYQWSEDNVDEVFSLNALNGNKLKLSEKLFLSSHFAQL